MTAISSTLFAVLLWGVIIGVALVFVYQVYAIASDAGLLDST
ncbi:hypothetical protein [Natronomonas aquatica]|jgi:hypothetical protein|nr:hypothetical protein [Natronomonas aquatica]